MTLTPEERAEKLAIKVALLLNVEPEVSWNRRNFEATIKEIAAQIREVEKKAFAKGREEQFVKDTKQCHEFYAEGFLIACEKAAEIVEFVKDLHKKGGHPCACAERIRQMEPEE